MRENTCNVLQTITESRAEWEGGAGAHSKTGQIDRQRIPPKSVSFKLS